MTYSDMIFAMDTGANYVKSKRGRKPYKKENELWRVIIHTNWMTYDFSEYRKTKEQGEKWVQWKIEEMKERLSHNNARAAKYTDDDDDYIREVIESIIIERTDRMNVKTTTNADC